jgi:hypothetical protein
VSEALLAKMKGRVSEGVVRQSMSSSQGLDAGHCMEGRRTFS